MPTGNSNVKRCALRRLTKLLHPVNGPSSSSTCTKLEYEFGSLYGSAYEAEVQCDGRVEEMNQLKQSLQQLADSLERTANNEVKCISYSQVHLTTFPQTSTRERLEYVEEEFSGRLLIVEEKLRLVGNDVSESLNRVAHDEVKAFTAILCPLT
jgi:hypothetical protein